MQTLDEEAMSHSLFDEGTGLATQATEEADLMLPGTSAGPQGESRIPRLPPPLVLVPRAP